jgi:ribosome-associated toxin RatA of RatAB toxin-antitoxin module
MRIAVAALVLCASTALRADAPADDGWEKKNWECMRPAKGCHIRTCCELSFGVWVREKPGSDVREVRAVGEIDAPPEKVYDVITDFEHYAEFMPYLEDGKVISRTQDEVVTWAIMNAPMVSRRDWVVRVKLDPAKKAGTTWTVATEGPPPTDKAVRLKINDGSWKLEALDGGKRTRATYYLYTDPGGSIPTWIANKANTMALPDLFEAIRKRVAK